MWSQVNIVIVIIPTEVLKDGLILLNLCTNRADNELQSLVAPLMLLINNFATLFLDCGPLIVSFFKIRDIESELVDVRAQLTV